jgi:hypothetical protein
MFALGMTTSSVAANKHGHVQVMGQMIAAIDNKLNTTLSIGETIGQPRPKTSQRNLRDAAKKSEYKPLCLNRSRKSTTTIHHDQEPALPKPGLEQGVNKPFRFKDDRKPKQGNRCLKSKPMASPDTIADSMYPKTLIYENQTTPSPCHPPFSGEVQSHSYLDTISEHNILGFSQLAPANTSQVQQYYYPQDARLQRGLLNEEEAVCFEQSPSPNSQAGFEHLRMTGYPQPPHFVTPIPQPLVTEVPPTIHYYKDHSQPLGNSIGYMQTLDTFTNVSVDVDWDQSTVFTDSPNLVPPLQESVIASSPKLARNEFCWTPTGDFTNNTPLF